MGIYQADAILKCAIDLFIEDLRCNLWLIDDVFSNFRENPYLKKKYSTQIQNAKDWFLNNKIYVEMGYVEDPVELPRISIILGDETQDADMSTMGDSSPITIKLLPNCIDKPIPFVLPPFIPVSYDIGSGILVIPATSLVNFSQVVSGQLLVNVSTGKGFPILNLIGQNMIMIADGSVIGTGNFAIVPKFAFYEARIEHIWQKVNYTLVCTALGNANEAIWLHDIVKYGLLRYKQGLLEALGLYESLFNSGPLGQNPDMTNSGEVVFERAIVITGKTQTTFIKAPHRLVENTNITNVSPNTPANPTANPSPPPAPQSEWVGGIEIASNLTSDSPAAQKDLVWFPVENDNE